MVRALILSPYKELPLAIPFWTSFISLMLRISYALCCNRKQQTEQIVNKKGYWWLQGVGRGASTGSNRS